MIAANDGPSSPAEWRAFMAQPAAYVDSTRLAACFGGRLGAELCGRLITAPRLQERLSALVHDHYALDSWVAPESCGAVDRAIALSPVERFDTLARHAGVVYWANSIANVVLARAVEALHQQLGEDLCAFALAHRDLAGAEQPLDPLETLGQRITADGWRCVAAWCHAQPEGVAMRVRLKFAPGGALDVAPEPPFDDSGPAIVRRAAS